MSHKPRITVTPFFDRQARSDQVRWQSATAAAEAPVSTPNTAKDDEGNSDRNGGGGGHQYLEQQQQLLLGLQTGGSKGNNNRRQQTNKERKAVEQQSHSNQESEYIYKIYHVKLFQFSYQETVALADIYLT